jgi:hypothetical protein
MPTNEELKQALECLVKGQKRAGVCAKCAYRKGLCYVTVPRHALERIRELETGNEKKAARRKTARWMVKDDGEGLRTVCSACGRETKEETPFCAACGMPMKAEETKR